MPKNLLILDYDNTLADAYGEYGEGYIFRNKTLSDVEQAGAIYAKYRRGPDDIVMFQALLDAYGITDALEFFREKGMQKQLFPDTIPWLTELKKYKNSLYTMILSTGDEDLQRIKLTLTGMYDMVDEVRITRDRNKIAYIKQAIADREPEKTFFIDDRIHMTEADFDTPVSIYEMDRKGEKSGPGVIHELADVDISQLIG